MKKLLVVAVLVALISIGGFIWWQQGFKAPEPNNNEKVAFVVQQGSNVRQIGSDLNEKGLIKDPVVFFLYLRSEGLDKNIQAGSYVLSPSMNLQELVSALRHGSQDVWITIPEGVRAEEIAQRLEENIETYEDSWVAVLQERNGYLFPDTYLIPKDANIARINEIIENNFNAKIDAIGYTQADPELEEIIIIASLIEREARFEEDRPTVASVIHNRLELGMPLQVDATVQYALGQTEDGLWWRTPRPEDLTIDSPYNTYQNPGLPPAPIANPGISAIEAAANPPETNYLYYVNDQDGNLRFAETLDAHNRNIERYLN